MRLARVTVHEEPQLAVETPDGFVPIPFTSFVELIAAGPDGLRRANDALGISAARRELKLLAPIARPGKIICTGTNYRSHLQENPSATSPSRPYFFAKLPSAVIGPGDAIVRPATVAQLDPEVELAVVIGRRARRVTAGRALDHIFGYTILNDVSAREWQFALDGQMMLGKGLDTFCPLGPVVVTADEVGDPGDLRLWTMVNGEVRQDSTTAECIFDVPNVLEHLTRDVTLEPGDVVSTGTPAGVGLFRVPQVWLQPGDEVVVAIDGIGELRNHVVAAQDG